MSAYSVALTLPNDIASTQSAVEPTSERVLNGVRDHVSLAGRLISLSRAIPVKFESQLYEFCSRGREQRAIEALLLRLEEDLHAGRFATVDDVLNRLDVHRVAPGVLVAALTITGHARAELRHRAAFVARAEQALVSALGADRAATLLTNRR